LENNVEGSRFHFIPVLVQLLPVYGEARLVGQRGLRRGRRWHWRRRGRRHRSAAIPTRPRRMESRLVLQWGKSRRPHVRKGRRDHIMHLSV